MDDLESTAVAPEFATETEETEPVGEEEAVETLGSKIASFLRTCWFKRRMVLGIVAGGILASVLYSLTLPNMYVSTTTLMPPDNAASPYSSIMGMLSPGNAAAQLGSEALGLNTPSDLFIGILKSRNVQDGLINNLALCSPLPLSRRGGSPRVIGRRHQDRTRSDEWSHYDQRHGHESSDRVTDS